MTPTDEPNPAMGWRAIRVGLDKPGILRMQLQAFLRATAGRELSVMFPFIAQYDEFQGARAELDKAITREKRLGHELPHSIRVGAMLETPSLAFAPDKFLKEVDFLAIGGNDLKQFFFAADRENERVRKRYDTLNTSFLNFLEQIVGRARETNTRLSFCGEDAGRPLEAICFAALGIHILSMRPASIGPVKHLMRRTDLKALKEVIDKARNDGHQSVRASVIDWVASNT
jgi:phosphotransferase system enzyme I (PtsP)